MKPLDHERAQLSESGGPVPTAIFGATPDARRLVIARLLAGAPIR